MPLDQLNPTSPSLPLFHLRPAYRLPLRFSTTTARCHPPQPMSCSALFEPLTLAPTLTLTLTLTHSPLCPPPSFTDQSSSDRAGPGSPGRGNADLASTAAAPTGLVLVLFLVQVLLFVLVLVSRVSYRRLPEMMPVRQQPKPSHRCRFLGFFAAVQVGGLLHFTLCWVRCYR